MSTIPKTKVWTDEELLALPKDGNKYEVMKGILTMSPAGFAHEFIGVRHFCTGRFCPAAPVSELFAEWNFD